MTFEAKLAELEKVLAADPKLLKPNTKKALFCYSAGISASGLQARFEAGERIALLNAIYWCALAELPMPAWVSSAYLQAYTRVESFESNSWDEVFGKPYPGKRLESLRKQLPILTSVLSAKQPIDNELFEAVGKTHGIGKTRVLELYSDAKKRLGLTNKKRKLRSSNTGKKRPKSG